MNLGQGNIRKDYTGVERQQMRKIIFAVFQMGKKLHLSRSKEMILQCPLQCQYHQCTENIKKLWSGAQCLDTFNPGHPEAAAISNNLVHSFHCSLVPNLKQVQSSIGS